MHNTCAFYSGNNSGRLKMTMVTFIQIAKCQMEKISHSSASNKTTHRFAN